MWTWLWSERRRRNLVLAGAGLLALALIVLVSTVRTQQARQSWAHLAQQRPTLTATDEIERPSGEPVARAVVVAWLAGDESTLAQHATADVVALLSSSARPARQDVLGASLSEDYDTYSSWSVALADGSHVQVDLSWARLGEPAWTATSVLVGA